MSRDTFQFNLSFEKHYFLKDKPKDICFFTLNSYNFDKVNTSLNESERKFLKDLIQRKDLVIQKADKGIAVVISNRENCLEVMKSLLFDKDKLIALNNDKSKWLNYIANLEKKLKEHFKTLENNKKYHRINLKVFPPLANSSNFCMDFLKSTKLGLIKFPNFSLYYQLLALLFIN